MVLHNVGSKNKVFAIAMLELLFKVVLRRKSKSQKTTKEYYVPIVLHIIPFP